MTSYETLLHTAEENNLSVIDGYNLSGTEIKGLYCDGFIAVSNELKNSTEKACVLAEEIGHYYTSSGNILDQTDAGNRKQERRARLWAYNNMIGLYGIIDCFKRGCRNRYEMAEHLGVTEEFLKDTLEVYRQKYGTHVRIDDYVICFEPNLSVMELRCK